ncbi:MAG: site-2 protease family protein [Halobacteriota archaeon]
MPSDDDGGSTPGEPVPRPDELESWYHLTGVRVDGERVVYYGEPLVPRKRLLEELWEPFHRRGYELSFARAATGPVLVAEPIESGGPDGVPWTNVILFVTTLVSTLVVGAYGWYYVPFETIVSNPFSVLQAWPFTAAVLGVLLVHELGHYAMGRYHGVNVSLPYVIPFVFPFGTLGAIIKMRGQMPSRKALFDIGVAGPIAGLAATVVVTAIGLSLGPVEIPPEIVSQAETGQAITFNNPPLLDIIAWAIGEQATYSDPGLNPHPVIIGGWVGMFFTLLNLLPVGQLDGGHMVRAMVGERQETIAALVPGALFGIAAYLYYVRDLGLNDSVGLWAFWGVFALFIAFNGPANPIDESSIGLPRLLVGLFTFGLGMLCFMLVPIQVSGV